MCRKQRTTGQPKATPRRLNYYTLLLTLAAVPRLVLLVLAPEAERPPFVFVALRASLDYFFGPLLPAPEFIPVREDGGGLRLPRALGAGSFNNVIRGCVVFERLRGLRDVLVPSSRENDVPRLHDVAAFRERSSEFGVAQFDGEPRY